jgi:hypothetical protein
VNPAVVNAIAEGLIKVSKEQAAIGNLTLGLLLVALERMGITPEMAVTLVKPGLVGEFRKQLEGKV